MNDNLLTALIGLAGSLVGALAALGGTWLTLWHTRKGQQEHWAREETSKEFNALRDAYVAWLDSLKTATEEAVTNKLILDANSPLPLPEHDTKGFTATRLLVLESSPEAHKRIKETISTFYDAMLRLRDEHATPADRSRECKVISAAFQEASDWVTEEFANVSASKNLTKPPSPSKRRRPPKREPEES